MLTEKEKDELYEEFKERMTREQIVKKRNALSEVREKHIKRWMKREYGDAAEGHYPPPAGFTGWDKISGFVAKTLYAQNIWRVGNHPGMEKLAVELAQELSDLYFKYSNRNWWYGDQEVENNGTKLAQDSEHGFEET